MDSKKRCSTCHALRPLTHFNVRSSASDGLQARCRECSRAWYLANKQTHIANVRVRSKRIRKDYQERLGVYFSDHPCVDCGESDVRVLDFDHEDPTLKVEAVCRLVGWSFAWERIEAEIAKCSVRCANCHRRRTSHMFRDWRHDYAERTVFDAAGRLASLLPASV